ncbi:hypothetical protein DSLASN_17860 [Desulfoluna limicola]|uniref:Uncharacterized protein n=1 Tax=Desulfoluna limicola TaxID=2810562 RepID=A0ABM7PFZ9_9BACT|nr:hypothetical protein [Desulfoluna limicola]BCS96154.1 hypothetical protein DSLASN_17860 [Desulfoluna limicola]
MDKYASVCEPGYFLRKQSGQSNGMLLMMVTATNEDVSKPENVRHGFLLDFLTLRASREH